MAVRTTPSLAPELLMAATCGQMDQEVGGHTFWTRFKDDVDDLVV